MPPNLLAALRLHYSLVKNCVDLGLRRLLTGAVSTLHDLSFVAGLALGLGAGPGEGPRFERRNLLMRSFSFAKSESTEGVVTGIGFGVLGDATNLYPAPYSGARATWRSPSFCR